MEIDFGNFMIELSNTKIYYETEIKSGTDASVSQFKETVLFHGQVIKIAGDKEELTVDIVVPEKYLNRFLTSEHKNEMCKELNIINTSGSVASWRTLKKLITSEGTGYKIQDTFKTIEGKRTRVSIISTTTNIE